MNEPVVERNLDFNKNLWYESPDPDFIELNFKSRVEAGWLSAAPVYRKYKTSGIMPISNYVDNIGTEPELVSISGNRVKLRQLAFADIFLLEEDGEDFYNVDRPWMRQYYNTNLELPQSDDCFPGTYKFFVTWVPKETTEISYRQSDADSPVIIQDKNDRWIFDKNVEMEFIQPHMVAFSFKRVGNHMEDSEFGVIRRGMPLFDMEFTVSDIILEEIRKFYAKD